MNNNKNTTNNSKAEQAEDIEMKEASFQQKTPEKDNNNNAPDAKDVFPTPTKKQIQKQQIQPCGERPQN